MNLPSKEEVYTKFAEWINNDCKTNTMEEEAIEDLIGYYEVDSVEDFCNHIYDLAYMYRSENGIDQEQEDLYNMDVVKH